MATAISAAQVKQLRDQTGAGMMECKNALTEANGDFDEANTILRKRGLASAAKKAGRTANEGLIANTVAADHASGILAEVNCESDFVARTPDFVQLMDRVLAEIEKAGDAANDAWLKDPQGPVIKHVAPVIAKLGENMGVSRFVRYAGRGYVGQYIHLGGKIAVMVEFAGVTPQAGIYTAVVAGFLISALGGSKMQIGGPTGAFIVILYGINLKYGAANLAICTVMAGVILLVMGVAGLGTMIKYIPYPVTMGFTSGIAILIFTTQIKDFFGLTVDKVPSERTAASQG